MYFKFVTLFGYGQAAIVFFALAFVFSTREKAFYLLFVHTVAGICNQELKILYRNPRPFMVSDEMQAISCSKSFGNPSGHSSLSACFYTTLFLIAFYTPKDTMSTLLI
jgi:membrane-associated phospholipid phosphatase